MKPISAKTFILHASKKGPFWMLSWNGPCGSDNLVYQRAEGGSGQGDSDSCAQAAGESRTKPLKSQTKGHCAPHHRGASNRLAPVISFPSLRLPPATFCTTPNAASHSLAGRCRVVHRSLRFSLWVTAPAACVPLSCLPPPLLLCYPPSSLLRLLVVRTPALPLRSLCLVGSFCHP
jgi:hypothetical protein